MKFLPPANPGTPVQQYSGHTLLDDYIDNTKQLIADKLPALYRSNTANLPDHKQQPFTNYKNQGKPSQ